MVTSKITETGNKKQTVLWVPIDADNSMEEIKNLFDEGWYIVQQSCNEDYVFYVFER